MKNFEKLEAELRDVVLNVPPSCINRYDREFHGHATKRYDQAELINGLCKCAMKANSDINHIKSNPQQLATLVGVLVAILGLTDGESLSVVVASSVEQYTVRQLIVDAGNMYNEKRPNLIDQLFHGKKNAND